MFVDSGSTPAPGSLAGKIAIFDVPPATIPAGVLTSLAYPGRVYVARELDPSQPKRPFNAIAGTIDMLEKLEAAGAAGAIGVHDYPFEGCKGTFFPYDGEIRDIPGIYVDRNVGAALRSQAQAGASARLSLPATIKRVNSRNLIGFIPGRSSELVTLHCHTDGSNAIEDNGPGAIVAISHYLSRLPRRALPRTIMILLTTGHFAGGNGSIAFCRRHENDLVKRTNAALTIEHLGTREWLEVSPGKMDLTGRYEPGSVFAPGSRALVDASFAAIKGSRGPAGLVLKPLNPNASGDPNEAAWPGEGQYLFSIGGISDANYISGPTYLLNWGIPTIDKVDHRVIRRQAIAYTEEILRLGRTPRSKLRNYTL